MNNMRISGLASGMDIDDMVSKLMKASRMPLEQLNQKKQLMEWQRDSYRTLNMKVLDLKNAAFNLKLQSAFSARKAAVSDESIVSVSPGNSSSEGIYSIQVNRLAKSASVTSEPLDNISKVTDPLSKLGLSAETTLTISGEKGTATIKLKPTNTLDELVAEVNGKSNVTGVKVSYDETMKRLFFVSGSTGDSSKVQLSMRSTTEDDNPRQNLLSSVLKLTGSTAVADKGQTVTGSVDFTQDGLGTLIDKTLTSEQKLKVNVSVGGVDTPYDIKISGTTTVGQLIDQINSSDLGKSGISAYLDNSGHLAFYNPDDSKTLSFTDITGGNTLLDKLGFNGGQSVINDIDSSQFTISGKDAIIEFNGVIANYKTNTFTVNGMSVTAKKEGSPAVNVTVTQDVDSTFNTIKSFVEKYNEFIDTVNKELSAKKYRDFAPLTEEQKKEMKEDDIKRWEEKAKSGMLRNDSLFSNALYKLRGSFTQQVGGLAVGDLGKLSEIGIGTALVSGPIVSGSYLENGKLYIDEAKLKKAISEKPEQVMNLFTKDDGNKETDSGDGIATRLNERLEGLFKQITSKAGTTDSVETNFTMGKQMKELNKRIDALTLKMETLESRYYKQFTAMEKYLNQMNAQSSWLAQQFGGQ